MDICDVCYVWRLGIKETVGFQEDCGEILGQQKERKGKLNEFEN